MVKNNIMNRALSMTKMLSLKIKYLKLEICIIWVGDSILKMYKKNNKLIKINQQKLNFYNDLQSRMENIIKTINKDLYNITHANSNIKNHISNHIRIYNEVKKITEEKFLQLHVLNNTIYVTEEQLINRLGFSLLTS
jgi:ABC-type dipeptide/oligopeptide/nickel transport system ATPase subunit